MHRVAFPEARVLSGALAVCLLLVGCDSDEMLPRTDAATMRDARVGDGASEELDGGAPEARDAGSRPDGSSSSTDAEVVDVDAEVVDVDAGPSGGDAFDDACTRNGDCASGVCVSVAEGAAVCSEICESGTDCVSGWSCGPIGGFVEDVCQCTRADEACNGVDDDCDGAVDEGEGAAVGCDPGHACSSATCTCRPENLCDGACVDLETNPDHCGECDRRCAAACSAGECVDVVGLASGNEYSCVWMNDGSHYCWGTLYPHSSAPIRSPRRITYPARVRMLDVGRNHMCVVSEEGLVHCRSQSGNPGLGNGVGGTGGVVRDLAEEVAVGVTTGSNHSCAWLEDGRAFCWGASAGPLGAGPGDSTYRPVEVVGIPDRVVQMSAGTAHTCARTAGQELYCWGEARYFSDGTGTRYTPQRVDITNVVDVRAGFLRTCARRYTASEQGALYCWGANLASASPEWIGAPTLVPNMGLVDTFDTASSHECAVLRSTGAGRCWGNNTYGQLGGGSAGDPQYSPGSTVTGLRTGLQLISTGTWFSCAVDRNGYVRCWGRNTNGQLGDGTEEDHSSPSLVRFGLE